MKSKKKQTVSLLLLLVVIVGLFPVSAAAEDNTGLCEHHPAHIGCTYAEAVLGADCRHVHDEFCGYGDECECTHTHDEACGYVEAADAVACNFVCESCSPPEANGENTEKNKTRQYTNDDLNTGTEDITPPVLNSVVFSDNIVAVNAAVEVTVDASDDMSGADSAIIWLYCETTGNSLEINAKGTYYDAESGENTVYADGLLHGTLEIDQYVGAGIFKVEAVQLSDLAGNTALYDDFNLPIPEGVKSLTLEITDAPLQDSTAPVLNGISFAESTVNAPGSVDVTVDASDDLSGTDRAVIRLYCETTQNTLEINASRTYYDSETGENLVYSDGLLHGTLEVDQYAESGIFAIEHVELSDLAGNIAFYDDFNLAIPEAVKTVVLQIVGVTAAEPDYMLDTELDEGTVVYIDGIAHVLGADGKLQLDDGSAKTLVSYSFHVGNPGDPHTQYPTGMRVWLLNYDPAAKAYNVKRVEALDNIMQYAGSSIRIAGKKGIRMITGVPQNVRSKLMDGGIEGYTLLEYGTAVAWASELGAQDLTLSFPGVKSNYAFRKGLSDPIFAQSNGLIQYTNVLVGFTNEQCVPDLVMRSYMKLQNKDGEIVTIYGGAVQRSIGYIAWQIRNSFTPGSEAYEYIWGIIRHVYGDTYDSEYRG